MLNKQRFDEFIHSHPVTDTGLQLITDALFNPPVRRVKAGFSRNSIYLIPSRKIEQSVQAESKLEYRYVVESEYSNDVIALIDQPLKALISCHKRNGRISRRYYTPDFLLLSESNGPVVVEVKSIGKLQELTSTHPLDWQSIDGEYIFSPAVDYFKELGLSHIVVNETHLNTKRNANYRLLLTLRDLDKDIAEDAELLKPEIIKVLHRTAALSLQDLAKELALLDLTLLLHLIDTGYLFADLDNSLLSIPSSTLVSTNQSLVYALQPPQITGPLISQEAIHSQCASVPIPPMSALMKGVSYIEKLNQGLMTRHLYRVRSKVKKGEANSISPLIAASPNYAGRGHRRDDIGTEHRQFIAHSIDTYMLDKNSSSRSCHAAYISYKADLEISKLTFQPISEPTFQKIVKQIHPEILAFARGGRRLRNSKASPTPIYTREIISTIPFEAASIDHHEIDLHVVVAESTRKKFTARVWLTMMRDHATKCILAMWISFDAPSRRAVGMVIRQCVRTYGGLPRTLYTDGGAEFRCDYLKQLYIYCNGTVVQHPAADGRSGSEAERPFGLVNTEWTEYRNGRIRPIQDSRSISSTHRPENFADLNIHEAWEELCLFREHQNSRRIGDMEYPPIMLLRDGMDRYPSMMIRRSLTDEFIIMTCVDCRDFTLDRQRGIHIGNRWFSHSRLFDPSLTKSSILVRIDPENPYCVFAQVNNEWVACLSRGHDEFLSLPSTERESTALRMGLGHAAREAARVDDQVSFVKKLHTIDARRKAEKMGIADACPSSASPEFKAEIVQGTRGLFEQARQQDIAPIITIAKPAKRA